MTFSTNIPGHGQLGPMTFHHYSYSSHDDEFAYPINITRDDNHWYYLFPEVTCHVVVDFKKIKPTLVYDIVMPGLRYVTPGNGAPATILPFYP